jgi:hypothetical protein
VLVGGNLRVVKDKAGYDLVSGREGGIQGGVVVNSEISPKNMECSFVGAHDVEGYLVRPSNSFFTSKGH